MTILKILTHPNPLLKQRSVKVTAFDKHLEALVRDMIETLHTDPNGVGLAAPQIGVLQRVIIAEFEGRAMVLINPKITKCEGSVVDYEGCLSVPGYCLNVVRAEKIIVEAQNMKGQQIQIHESDFFARIIQHEIDHLDGMSILDRAVRITQGPDFKAPSCEHDF
ncbi:peptide deformylase [Thermoproteota archaeon]